MSLRDGTNLSRWEGGLFDRDNPDSVSLLFRLLWLFTAARAEGIGIELNEAGRPLGDPRDRPVGRAGRPASETVSGLSTVFYQKGREDGGFTPSAADPYGVPSRHMLGLAGDLWCNNYGRLDQLAARVGMRRTISSEIWHYEIVGDPIIPASEFARFSAIVNAILGGGSTTGGNAVATLTSEQIDEKEIDMTTGQILDGQRDWASWLNTGVNGRLDNQVLPMLRIIASSIVGGDKKLDEIIEAGKIPFYQIAPSGRGAAIDVVEGYVKTYGSYEEYQNDVRLGYVSGKPRLVSEADWNAKINEARQRLAAITADPTVPGVDGSPA
jgi:hypothetical protein